MRSRFFLIRIVPAAYPVSICCLIMIVLSIAGCAGSDHAAEKAYEVDILLPEDGEAFREGEVVEFEGSGIDSRGNVLDGDRLIWTSDIDGFLGSGAAFETDDLSVGCHRICLSASGADDEGEFCIGIYIKSAVLAQVSAGFDHILAVGIDGGLWAWGANDAGQIGDGSTESSQAPVPVAVESKWTKAAAGDQFSVGLRDDGTIWFWGRDPMDNFSYLDQLCPVLLSEDEGWEDIDASAHRITAITSDGRCYFWEGGHSYIWNGAGFIGDEADSHWKTAATGFRHVLMIKTDGTLWCRSKSYSIDGYDRFYHLNNWDWFKQIGEAADWVQIDAYENMGIALSADGAVYALSFQEDDVAINRIGTDADWETAAIGWNFCAAIKQDGSLWTCSGYEQGQTAISLQQYGNDNDWMAAASGYDFTVALTEAGNPVVIGELPPY